MREILGWRNHLEKILGVADGPRATMKLVPMIVSLFQGQLHKRENIFYMKLYNKTHILPLYAIVLTKVSKYIELIDVIFKTKPPSQATAMN